LYAASRFSFVLLDLAALIETALDRQQYRTLVDCSAVGSLREGASLLLKTLDMNFPSARKRPADAAERGDDRQSYVAAIGTLGRAGIAVQADGIERYVSERREWEPLACRVAPVLGYGIDEIDRRNHQMRRTGSTSAEDDRRL
jgi:hypothetical protein